MNCIDGHVISYSGKYCFPKSKHILNCRRYKEDATGCALCDTKYYLDSKGFCHRG